MCINEVCISNRKTAKLRPADQRAPVAGGDGAALIPAMHRHQLKIGVRNAGILKDCLPRRPLGQDVENVCHDHIGNDQNGHRQAVPTW